MDNVYYRDIIIKTYVPIGENSSSKIRAHPVAGQGLPEELNVECSKVMREENPVGSYIKLRAKITDREGTFFIYNRYSWGYSVLSEQEAKDYIEANN